MATTTRPHRIRSHDSAPHRAVDRGTGEHELVTLLHARGGRATPQRLVILRELRRLRRHATAEEIARAVRTDLPGTSMPTVYATLELLVDLGLARRLDIGFDAAIYDPRTEPHQHAVCRRCGRLEDLDVELDASGALRAARRKGFRPDRPELIVSGLCAGCARAEGVK